MTRTCFVCGRKAYFTDRESGEGLCGLHRSGRKYANGYVPGGPWDRLALTAAWLAGSSQERERAAALRLKTTLENR